jgi:hypothetical protein
MPFEHVNDPPQSAFVEHIAPTPVLHTPFKHINDPLNDQDDDETDDEPSITLNKFEALWIPEAYKKIWANY